MADFISAAASSASAKPPELIQLNNPAVSPNKPDPSGLSEAAQSALSSVGEMQKDMQKSFDASNERRAEALSDANRPSMETSTSEAMSEATRAIQMQMEVSLRVQQQLTRFVMVSSVSSSFGKNLNMFLRGQ